MTNVLTERTPTFADLQRQLGDIPPNRILIRPYPGTATEQDVLDIEAREDRLCELVDGVLVEKTAVFSDSVLGALLACFVVGFVREHNLGVVAGANGPMRLAPGLVRIPDLSFVSWDRLPGRKVPNEPIPDLVPDLAVEILSEGNTCGEMERKLSEYFAAGVHLVWYVDQRDRTVRVHTAVDRSSLLNEGETLDGGDVLPGFVLPLAGLFALPFTAPTRVSRLTAEPGEPSTS